MRRVPQNFNRFSKGSPRYRSKAFEAEYGFMKLVFRVGMKRLDFD